MNLLSKDRKNIISDIIEDVHNIDFRGNLRPSDEYWYEIDKNKENINLEWLEYRPMDKSAVLLLVCSVLLSLYIGLSSNLNDIVLSIVLLVLLISPSILFDRSCIIYYFSRKVSETYKLELEHILNKYIDVLEMESKKKDILDIDLYKISLVDHLDIKYILVGESEILFRLINKIKEKNPKLIKVLVTDSNADVIITKKKNDIPEIDIMSENIAVEYHIDNGVFCIGLSDENIDIVKICVDNMNVEVIEDCGLNVLVR